MELETRPFGHTHPLVFNEGQDNQSEKEAKCSRCGEEIALGPSFSCMEEKCTGFHLHKQCAEAPSEIHHPFHRDHPLLLRPNPPTMRRCSCDFCGQDCKMFVYHCSACALHFHIKCALFSYSIAVDQRNSTIGELPLISDENRANKELESAKCFGCWNPLLESACFSLDCGFNLHKKCAQLPLEINHPLHPQNPLILQFNSKRLRCKICNQTQLRGFVYRCLTCCSFALHIKCADLPLQIDHLCHRKHPLLLQFNDEDLCCKICQGSKCKGFVYSCSLCKFVIHRECVSQPPAVIEDTKSHPHPFTLFWRLSFICDACGLEGSCVSYTCSTCSLTLHQKCISLPRAVKITWHHHPLLHIYFLRQSELTSLDCRLCREEIDTEYGSYYCKDCNFIVHVDCATSMMHEVVELENNGLKLMSKDLALLSDTNPITSVLERNENGEATKIKHFSHAHVLMLGDKIPGGDDGDDHKRCNGCIMSISTMFYSCLQCDFFLHKSCAELPMKRVVWFHNCRDPVTLVSDYIFVCRQCRRMCSGFAYKCNLCNTHNCVRCCEISDIHTSPGHEHPLSFHTKYSGSCNGCGRKFTRLHKCKSCQFAMCVQCLTLLHKIRHKCDEHVLSLTYHENNDYLEYLYCDICEERRNLNDWFYHCAICITSCHVKCVLGEYPFIKEGRIYKAIVHPHPLTFVKKTNYDHPKCDRCGKLCQDLALECGEPGCIYIVHWKCVKPPYLSYDRVVELYKNETDVSQD